MDQERKDSIGFEVAADADATAEFIAPPRAAWRRPNFTIIDIRKTMLIAGSVIDGISGSI
jgi:hypothetical protein